MRPSNTAGLYRADWDRYKKTFYQHEDQLLNFVSGDEPIADALNNTRNAFSLSADNTRKGLAQSMASYGSTETARQKQAREKSMRLAESGALTSGLNQARLHVKNQQQNVLTGGSLKNYTNQEQ